MSLGCKKIVLEQIEKHIHHQLIERARQFDRQAQGELYRNYSKAMFHTSLRIVADQFMAEDIMQDAFIAAFRKIKDLDDNRNFGSWLKRMVVNYSLNQVNREKRISEKLTEIELEPSAENDSLEAEVQEVKQAMKQLARQYQIVFSLHLIEGYDHEEISEILGISASASRSHYSRAKKKVREIVEQKKMNSYESRSV